MYEKKPYTLAAFEKASTLLLSSIQMLNQVIRDLTKRPLPAAAVRDRFKSAPSIRKAVASSPVTRHTKLCLVASCRWRHRRTP